MKRIGVAMLLLSCAACARDASLSRLVPGALGVGTSTVWLNILFKRYPSDAIDRKDVEVRFTSLALDKPASYDWQYIATHDVVPPEVQEGNVPNEDTQPDADPPLGKPTRCWFAIPYAQNVLVKSRDDLDLKATLYWGGRERDSISSSIGLLYKTAPQM